MLQSQLMIDVQSNLFRIFEKRLRANLDSNHNFIPIWIIGAPRTGTTLVYQALCRFLNCTYISNRVAKRYRIAILARKYERKFIGNNLEPTSFSSTYGRTIHPSDPHEAGAFFYQFFPKNQSNHTSTDIAKIKTSGLVEMVNEITKPSEVFISKNTYHSLRIKVLIDLFPKSIFLWVRRDLPSTMKSIYKARLDIGDINKWWGLNPTGWEDQQAKTCLEQIEWQINKTNEIIQNDLEITKAEYFEMNYNDFCKQPKDGLHDFLNSCNLSEKMIRKNSDLPSDFTRSISTADEIDKMLRNYLEKKNDKS